MCKPFFVDLLKYVFLIIALCVCSISNIASITFFAFFMLVDIYYGELMEQHGRRQMIKKSVQRQIRKVVKEERQKRAKTRTRIVN